MKQPDARGRTRIGTKPRATAKADFDLLLIPTFEGTIFVPNCLETVQRLIHGGHIRAGSLDTRHHQYHQCLRRLFLLATLEALEEPDEFHVRALLAGLCDCAPRRRQREHRPGQVESLAHVC